MTVQITLMEDERIVRSNRGIEKGESEQVQFSLWSLQVWLYLKSRRIVGNIVFDVVKIIDNFLPVGARKPLSSDKII